MATVETKKQTEGAKKTVEIKQEPVATKPAVEPTNTSIAKNNFTAEENEALALMKSLLAEYTSKITHASDLKNAQGTYTKLHGAFRNMMNLRGATHKAAFQVFLEAFKQHSKKSLAPDLRYRHIDLLGSTERVVFTGYLDLIWRFSSSTDKGNFRKMNDIDRLLSKIADPELRDSINAVFP